MKTTNMRWAALYLLSVASSAGYGVTLSVIPQDSVLTAGETSSFDVRIEGLGDQMAPSLGAYEIGVDYNPAVIAVDAESISYGTELIESLQRILTDEGNVTLIEVSFVDPETLDLNQAGSFDLATVPFTASEVGVSQIDLTKAILGDALGLPIDDVVLENASVRVEEIEPIEPAPPLTPDAAAVGTALINGCAALMGRPSEQLTAGERGLLQTCGTLVDLPPEESAALLDEAAPKIQKPAARIGIWAAQQQFHNVTMRLNELRGDSFGFTTASSLLEIDGHRIDGEQIAALVDALSGGGASSDGLGGRWGFFVNGSIGNGDRDETQRGRGFEFDIYNITAGVDYQYTDKLFVGAALGYGNTNADFDRSTDRTDVNGWSAMFYGTYLPTDATYVDAIVSLSSNDYDVRRRDPFSGLNAKGDTDGSSFSASLGAGYDLNRGPWTFGPHGRLSYVTADVDGYQESPVAGNEYRFKDQDAESFTLTLGGRASYAVSTSYGVMLPHAWLDWTHEFSNDGDLITARLVNDPTGTPINLDTEDPDRDVLHLGLGVSAQFAHGRSAYIYYERLFGHSYVSLGTLQAGLRLEF